MHRVPPSERIGQAIAKLLNQGIEGDGPVVGAAAQGHAGFENAKPAMSAGIAGTSDYRKNPRRIDADWVRRIKEHRRFGFDAFGYRLEEWEAQTIPVP